MAGVYYSDFLRRGRSDPDARRCVRKMSGPMSWLLSLGLVLAGSLLGYVIFTLVLGIGENDILDWGGLIGTLIVVGVASIFLRRRSTSSPPMSLR